MKPTEDLMNEHRVIERMLAVVKKATDMLEKDQTVESDFFRGAADFFKNFADKCHHSKEEQLLFKRLLERGMSSTQGPIPVLLHEHEVGRAHVRKIAELSEAKFDPMIRAGLIDHGRAYVDLLTVHIQKEDRGFFSLANRMLTDDDQHDLERGFEDVEEKVMGPGVHERYHHMIEEFEEKLR